MSSQVTTATDKYQKSNAASREPSPNRGGSIPDFQAIGPDSESKEEWLKKQGIDVTKQVKFSKLSHMRYQHPDLQQITTFLRGKFVIQNITNETSQDSSVHCSHVSNDAILI